MHPLTLYALFSLNTNSVPNTHTHTHAEQEAGVQMCTVKATVNIADVQQVKTSNLVYV